MFFFKVCNHNAKVEYLKPLIAAHKGEYGDVDLFDGKEHNYMEIGAWIGDQSTALMLMGMGKLLGMWELLTPNMLGFSPDDSFGMFLARSGMIAIQASPKTT